MRIEYLDKHDQYDPAIQRRLLAIVFETDEELAALNRAGTGERIIDYTRRALNAFLAENRTYFSQLNRGRSE